MEAQNKVARIEFDQEQLALIKSQIAPNAKPAELQLFLYQCKRTGLDPLTRQIYCIHRGGKMTIQTSIDGFRVIAERSGDYAGQSEPKYIEGSNGELIGCKIAVYRFRGDVRYQAAVGVAYLTEYNAGGPMWQKMPRAMIAKCAEAAALRKAYPQDLSGLYTGDEMEQAETQDVQAEVINPLKKADAKGIKDALLECTTKKEVKALFEANSEAVYADADLQESFKRLSSALDKAAQPVTAETVA